MSKLKPTEVGEFILARLKEDGRCNIPGVGVLKVKDVDQRTYRNPRTMEPVTVAAHKAVKFSQASNLSIG